MKQTILVIEGDDVKYASLNEYLTAPYFSDKTITRYDSIAAAWASSNQRICAVLAGFSIISAGNFGGMHELQNAFVNIPIIVLAADSDKEGCMAAVKKGAQDFLVWGRFDVIQLDKALCCAIQRQALLVKREHVLSEYEKHFNDGPMPMWIIDGKTMKFLIVNNATVQKYGYTKEDFALMSPRDIRPEEDIEAIERFFHQKKDGYYDAGYWRHKKKNGEIFYVHVYSHVIEYNGIDARLSVIIDVNEKVIADKHNKELMALIQEQKEDLDSILGSVSDAIWSRRADTMELIYANNAYYKLYDHLPGEPILGKSVDVASIHPADRAALSLSMHEVQTSGKTEIVYRYIHKDGSIKILKVIATLKKGGIGKPDIITGVTVDITKEKELYDAIRNSEQKLRATINNTQDLIWTVNAKLELIFCNKAFQDFFYKITGSVLDEGDYVLGDWHDEAFISQRKVEYQRAFNGDSFTSVVQENYDGNILYFEISSNPIIDVDGKIVGVNCISRDITAQKTQLIQIQQQNEQLKEIAWIQSHRVRGPVASILGLIELFDVDSPGEEQNLEILRLLKDASADLDHIIKEIVRKTNDLEHSDKHRHPVQPKEQLQ